MSRVAIPSTGPAGNAAMPFKYRLQPVDLPDRQWPAGPLRKRLGGSVDLRDGNQALIDPMRPEEKLRFWNLPSLGLEEIEVGFPVPRKRILISFARSSRRTGYPRPSPFRCSARPGKNSSSAP